ncbi:MAG: tetratricopeptide repeat protein [Candidatus Paceibacterota bacterium]
MDKNKSDKVSKKIPVLNHGFLVDKLAFGLLLLGILLLPFVFYPIPGTSIVVVKKFFILSIILAAFLLWLVGRLQTGSIKISQSAIVWAALLLPASFLVSGLFSGAVRNSLVGNFYQSETFLSVLFLWLLLFLVLQFFSDKNRLFNFYVFFSFSGLVLGLYTLARFFLGPYLSQTYTDLLPVSLVGFWYESGVIFGLVAIITLSILELLNLSQTKSLKIVLNLTLVVSLVCLVLINYSTVWLLVGLLALGLFIFSVINKEEKFGGIKSMIKYSSVTFVISLVFFALSGPNGFLFEPIDEVYNNFEFSFLEIRPGINSTVEILKQTAENDLLLGVGPNNFTNAWINYRPRAVNESLYWNTNFEYVFGILPTYIIVSGLLGFLSILILLGTLIYGMFRGVWLALNKNTDPLEKTLILLGLIFNLYVWSMLVLYTPIAVGLPLAFVGLGIFLATLVKVGLVKENKYSLYNSQIKRISSITLLLALLIMTLFSIFNLSQRFWSVVVYSEATRALAAGNFEEADSLLVKALAINNKNPLYFRTLTGLKLRQLNDLLNTQGLSQDDMSSQVKSLIDVSVSGAKEAVRLHPLDYQNLLVLGGVYEFLASLGLEGISSQSYETAKSTYEEAFLLNPNNPEILFNMARLEISQNNFTTARDLLDQALSIKTNHNSSIVLLSQLDIEDNNMPAAIGRLEAALAKDPTNTNLLFQLGLLQYRNNNINNAIEALTRAINFSQGGINANASYFLGLSYDARGERIKAIEQFEIINQYNPNNQEVAYILNNLRAGRTALSGLNSVSNIEESILETAGTVEESNVLDVESINTDE